jgi:hypothetical protein
VCLLMVDDDGSCVHKWVMVQYCVYRKKWVGGRAGVRVTVSVGIGFGLRVARAT